MFKIELEERKTPLSHPRPKILLDECLPATYRDISAFAQAMKKRGIKPEMEIYHPGQYWVVHDLLAQGLVEPPYLIQFVMGTQTPIYPTPMNLISLVNELPVRSVFEVAGIGPYQWPMAVMAIVLGGHVRVGMEDNIYYRRGQLLKSNAEAVERVVRIAREMNREIATPAQAREMLRLSQTPSSY